MLATMTTPDLLTTREVADRLGITPRHVARLGLAPAIKLPGRQGAALWDPAEVADLEREREAAA